MGRYQPGRCQLLFARPHRAWFREGQQFSRSPNKLAYAYFLTPAGIAEKTALTGRFLERKMDEYEALKIEIQVLTDEVARNDPPSALGG